MAKQPDAGITGLRRASSPTRTDKISQTPPPRRLRGSETPGLRGRRAGIACRPRSRRAARSERHTPMPQAMRCSIATSPRTLRIVREHALQQHQDAVRAAGVDGIRRIAHRAGGAAAHPSPRPRSCRRCRRRGAPAAFTPRRNSSLHQVLRRARRHDRGDLRAGLAAAWRTSGAIVARPTPRATTMTWLEIRASKREGVARAARRSPCASPSLERSQRRGCPRPSRCRGTRWSRLRARRRRRSSAAAGRAAARRLSGHLS